jgi:hypothetical protein
VHRRSGPIGRTRHEAVPITKVADTVVDLAIGLPGEQLERAVNEAVNRDLTDPERLRDEAAAMRRREGACRVSRSSTETRTS